MSGECVRQSINLSVNFQVLKQLPCILFNIGPINTNVVNFANLSVLLPTMWVSCSLVSLLSLYFFAHRISPDTDPRSAFYIGQVMICYVLSCQPDQAKLRLSFKVQHNISLIFLAFKRQLHQSRLTGFTLFLSLAQVYL